VWHERLDKAERVESAHGVVGKNDARTHRLKGGGSLENRYLPALFREADRCHQATNAGSYDYRALAHAAVPSVRDARLSIDCTTIGCKRLTGAK
jgi:hypothetical protein